MLGHELLSLPPGETLEALGDDLTLEGDTDELPDWWLPWLPGTGDVT